MRRSETTRLVFLCFGLAALLSSNALAADAKTIGASFSLSHPGLTTLHEKPIILRHVVLPLHSIKNNKTHSLDEVEKKARLGALKLTRVKPTSRLEPIDRSGIFRKIGRLQLGGVAVRRSRPGQVMRPTEAQQGQELHLRGGLTYRASSHLAVISEFLYIQPATQSLFFKNARSPLQIGMGAKIYAPHLEVVASAGGGISQMGGILRPGLFIMLFPHLEK